MAHERVYYNPGSGNAESLIDLRLALPDESTHWIKLSHDTDLHQSVSEAIATGCRTVVAAGGDGTINAIVNALMGFDFDQRPALAIVPLGSANDFAGTLGIPDEVALAAELIFRTTAVPTDVVRASNGSFVRYFANVAAGGNCVRVSESLTGELKSRWGALSYIRGALDVLPDMITYRVSMRCDGEEFADLNSWAVLIANGRTNAGRIEVAPKASPVDGLMDVILIRDGTIADMIQIVANNLLGDFLASEQVVFRQAKSLVLESTPPMRFTLDGEVIDEFPNQFDVMRGAIKMHRGV